jgi:iron complex transport system ATP-binding protein
VSVAAAKSAALVFEDVRFELAGRQILRGVCCEVQPGQVTGLLGANGAGKTTLLRLATRVLDPGGGRVLLHGRALSEVSRRELAQQLAIVPQDTHVPFPFSVEEVVLMGRAPHQKGFAFDSRADLERAGVAMETLGVAHLATRSIQEISGGERQLVMLARAFAQQPSVLLLDEPTAFLDLRHRIAVLQAVRSFAAAGGAALLVSHDLGLAARACDRVALLADGVIRHAGAPAEVLTPGAVEETFGIAAQVLEGPDGSPLVVPALAPEPDPQAR